MTSRSFHQNNILNYPKIQIDRANVIKPCVSDMTAADQFVGKPGANWRKVVHNFWLEGLPFVIRYISNLHEPTNGNIYYIYLIRIIKYVVTFITHVYTVYLHIYGYFYPYSLMSLDEICDEFSRCPKWSESIIRAFAWHPNHDRCALSLCNDYIYVYQNATRLRVLRHNLQRKITVLAWKPSDKDILVVATQTHILIWRISESRTDFLGLKDNSIKSNLAYLAPGSQISKRQRDTLLNGSSKNKDCISDYSTSPPSENENLRIFSNILSAPLISIQFDIDGDKLYVVSPNSAKIAIVDIAGLISSQNSEKVTKYVTYIRRFGEGISKIRWSPSKNRLAAAFASSFFEVFEPFRWTSSRWTTHKSVIQDLVWSRPAGKMLLVANKSEPILYVMPFLDDPQPKDVGGGKSLMKALDLTAARSEFGDVVGGRIQSFAWDKEGRRLAISFKDNPQSILLYRTVEKPTLEFHQMGVLKSDNNSSPLLMDFHDKFKNGSLLTICWSDGNCQHIPLTYSPFELNQPTSPSVGSSPKTPRSLTNFCHVSGSNSISSFTTSLMPINKVQNQTTLFSLSSRSPLAECINSNSIDN